MNLARLVIIALVVWLAIQVLRRLGQRLNPPKPAAKTAAKTMVRCAFCRLHLPETEAISQRGQHFCCEDHRRRHYETLKGA